MRAFPLSFYKRNDEVVAIPLHLQRTASKCFCAQPAIDRQGKPFRRHRLQKIFLQPVLRPTSGAANLSVIFSDNYAAKAVRSRLVMIVAGGTHTVFTARVGKVERGVNLISARLPGGRFDGELLPPGVVIHLRASAYLQIY